MTSTQAMEVMDDYFDSVAEADKKRNELLDKVVKEVCINIETYTENAGEDHVMKMSFTATDGTYIRSITQKNEYAGRYINKLAEIWGCEPKMSVLKQATSEQIKKVLFYKYTRGEYEFQDFRKPNAIEIAQYNSSLHTPKEA